MYGRVIECHNDLTPEQREKVSRFRSSLGPYESDIWSGAYDSEVLEEIEYRESRKKESHGKEKE